MVVRLLIQPRTARGHSRLAEPQKRMNPVVLRVRALLEAENPDGATTSSVSKQAYTSGLPLKLDTRIMVVRLPMVGGIAVPPVVGATLKQTRD